MDRSCCHFLLRLDEFVSRALDTSDLRLVKWSLRSGESECDEILYALSLCFMRLLICEVTQCLCFGSMVIEQTGASRSKEVRMDAVTFYSSCLMSILCCWCVGRWGKWWDIKRFSCSVFILLRLVMRFVGDFGDSMLRVRWLKSWPAIKGESELKIVLQVQYFLLEEGQVLYVMEGLYAVNGG